MSVDYHVKKRAVIAMERTSEPQRILHALNKSRVLRLNDREVIERGPYY